jgi:hypothetical protein
VVNRPVEQVHLAPTVERGHAVLRRTTSLCPTCGREIPATIYNQAGQAIMVKQCLSHGEMFTVVEKSAAFLRWVAGMPRRNLFRGRFLHVTRHCNMRCDPCYFPIDNKSVHPTLGQLLAEVGRTSDAIYVTGGEPTTHPDLLRLVAELVKQERTFTIMTNGLALADQGYLDALLAACGESFGTYLPVALSLHLPQDSSPEQYAKKLQALGNIRSRGKYAGSLMFTISSLGQLPAVLSAMSVHRDLFWLARIRIASSLWMSKKTTPRLFASDLLRRIQELGEEKKVPVRILRGLDNTLYHMNVKYDGMACRLISYPDVENVDLDELRGWGPYVLTDDGQKINVLHAGMLAGIQMKMNSTRWENWL